MEDKILNDLIEKVGLTKKGAEVRIQEFKANEISLKDLFRPKNTWSEKKKVKEVLILNHEGVDYTPAMVMEEVGLMERSAVIRMKKALAGKISPEDVFRPMGAHVQKDTEDDFGAFYPAELRPDQWETIQGFARLTRNDDKLIKKYYA